MNKPILRREFVRKGALFVPGYKLARAQRDLPLLGAGGGASAPQTPTFVTQTIGSVGAGSSYATTIPAPANGNSLVVCVSTQHGASLVSQISSITGTGMSFARIGNAFQGPLISGTTRYRIETWIGQVSAGAGTSVTINLTLSLTTSLCSISEWSGVLTTGTINDGNAGTGAATSTSPAPGAYTAAASNDLVIASAVTISSVSFTADQAAHFTPLTAPGINFHCSYIAPAASGAQPTDAWTIGSSSPWLSLIIGYKHG